MKNTSEPLPLLDRLLRWVRREKESASRRAQGERGRVSINLQNREA